MYGATIHNPPSIYSVWSPARRKDLQDPVGHKGSKSRGLISYIYFSTEVLSVQKTEFSKGICIFFLHSLSICAATTASLSSSLGMVISFKGTTLDFPKTRVVHCTTAGRWPFHNLPHLCLQNDVIGQKLRCQRFTGLKPLLIFKSSSSSSCSCNQFVHFCAMGVGTTSSDPRPFLHRSCKIRISPLIKSLYRSKVNLGLKSWTWMHVTEHTIALPKCSQ